MRIKCLILAMLFLVTVIIVNAAPTPCKYIIWGYILSNGYPVKGYDVILQDVRAGAVDRFTTGSSGLYIFRLYSGGGNYNVTVDMRMNPSGYHGSGTSSAIGGTVTVVDYRAVRMDLDISGSKFLKTRNEQSVGYICYITETGNLYHAINCQYLWDSCISVPYDFIINEGYEPCTECLK